jgi:hypothetical protein
MDSHDIGPGDDFVDSLGVLQGYGIAYVGEFTVFEDQEVVFLG